MKVALRNVITRDDNIQNFSAEVWIDDERSGLVHNSGDEANNTYTPASLGEPLDKYAATLPALESPWLDITGKRFTIVQDADVLIGELLDPIQQGLVEQDPGSPGDVK
jgi:hypothetical protein